MYTRHVQTNVLSLVIGSTVNNVAIPTSQATLPSYLSSLSVATLSTGPSGLSQVWFNEVATTETINSIAFPGFTASPLASAANGGLYLETYTLGNTYSVSIKGPHLYHQHVNHFQVISSTGSQLIDDIARANEWRDVAPGLGQGTVIRFMPDSFTGYMVMHCHLLQHEDYGMMAVYNVVSSSVSSSSSLTTGGIIGIVLGSVAVVAIVAYVFYRKNKTKYAQVQVQDAVPLKTVSV